MSVCESCGASYVPRTVPREDRAELIALVKSLGGTQEQLDACVHPKVEPAGIKAKAPPKARAAKGKAA